MSPSSPLRIKAAEQAAAWRLRLDAEDAQEADWLAFEDWLSADPEHKAAYDAMERGLVDLELHREEILALARTQDTAKILSFRPRIGQSLAWLGAGALAAGLALAIIIARAPGPEIAYAAPATHDRVVALADGSSVHLNRGASIRVRFGGGARRIELEHGEASFRVVHDASNPFEVSAGVVVIRDIGTEFNVMRNAGSLVVAVRSGVVELQAEDASRLILNAGRQARLEPGAAIAVTDIAPDDAFAWQSGRLVYHNASLSQIIEDLNRYSDTPIVASPDAARLRFSGVLEIDRASSMLARLENFLPIHVEADQGRILVKGVD